LATPQRIGAQVQPGARQATGLLSLALRPISVREDAPQLFVAAHESGIGPSRRFAAMQQYVGYRGHSGLWQVVRRARLDRFGGACMKVEANLRQNDVDDEEVQK
jgi:hypothetical protein